MRVEAKATTVLRMAKHSVRMQYCIIAHTVLLAEICELRRNRDDRNYHHILPQDGVASFHKPSIEMLHTGRHLAHSTAESTIHTKKLEQKNLSRNGYGIE
jgi:hypothetical protein